MLKTPIVAVASSDSHVAIAFDHHIQLISNAENPKLVASTLEDTQNAHSMRITIIAMNADVLVTSGEDKLLKVWNLPDLQLRSSRPLAKRANAVRLHQQSILLSDKFGDVFDIPIDSAHDQPEYTLDAKKRPPVLGHVSMLTDFALLPLGDKIITCDRDEHIRISRWPEGYDIIEYLWGHSRAVVSLACVDATTLYSAGADPSLFVWDLGKFELRKTIDISVVSSYSVVNSPRYEARKAKRAEKPNRKRKRRKGQVVPEEEPVEAPPSDPAPLSEPSEADRRILIKKLLLVNDKEVLLLASGATALFHVNVESETVTPIDLGTPALDACQISGDDQAPSFLLSLDASRLEAQERSSVIVTTAPGKVPTITESPLTELLAREGSVEITKDRPFPSVSTIYWELDLLFKESYEAEEGGGDGDVTLPFEEEQADAERPNKVQKQDAPKDASQK